MIRPHIKSLSHSHSLNLSHCHSLNLSFAYSLFSYLSQSKATSLLALAHLTTCSLCLHRVYSLYQIETLIKWATLYFVIIH